MFALSRFASLVGFAPLLVGAVSLAACSGAAPTDNAAADTSADELSTTTCGGFVAHPKKCRAGYTCVADAQNPDLPGHCEKEKYCVMDCVAGEHFVQDDQGCHCEPDAPKTCEEAICFIGGHCEMKGLNGGDPVPVCVKDNGPTCLTLTCETGYHCEEKGINGGTVAACVAN